MSILAAARVIDQPLPCRTLADVIDSALLAINRGDASPSPQVDGYGLTTDEHARITRALARLRRDFWACDLPRCLQGQRSIILAGAATRVAYLTIGGILADRRRNLAPVAPVDPEFYQPSPGDEAEAAAVFAELDAILDAREQAEWELEQELRAEASAAIDRACGVPSAFALLGHDA